MKKADEINYKVFNRTSLGLKKLPPNPMLSNSESDQNISENLKLLEQARLYFSALSDFRKRATRARKYYRGDQWSDVVYDPDIKAYVTEAFYISKQGKVPLKQNIIRQLVRNQIGQYRMSVTKPIAIARKQNDRKLGDIVSAAIDYVGNTNMLGELDARAYETALLTGMVVQKQGYTYIKERDIEDIFIENRNVHRIFFNPDVTDVRCTDLRMIGEIHDIPIDQIISSFARSKQEEERIKEIFRAHSETIDTRKGLSADNVDNTTFTAPAEMGKGRLYEIWYLKNEWKHFVHDEATGKMFMTKRSKNDIEAENRARIEQAARQGIPADEVPLLIYQEKNEQVWHVKYLTYSGVCLYESETIYEHGEHPYSIMLYPLVDGEVWGFVEDIIDQQRYINRTIILLDFIMSSSAKGVLLIAEDMLGEKTPEEFAAEWKRFDGVIVYRPKPGVEMPKQISANSVNAGFKELISLQMTLINDISGTHGAIQGKSPSSGTAASLYEQEANNATINSFDYLQSFYSYKKRRDRKIMKNILQFYDEERNIAISGESSLAYSKYDPKAIRQSEYDLVESQAPNTPTYKSLVDDRLFEFLKNNLIDIKMYLKHSTMPYAEALLEDISQMEQSAGNIEDMNRMGKDIANKANPDPQAMELIRKAIGNRAA